jgi:hypothetical protein
MLVTKALLTIFVYNLLTFVVCVSSGTKSLSPTSSSEWKQFLNLSPDRDQAESSSFPTFEPHINDAQQIIPRSRKSQYSTTKGAIKSRNFRAKMSEEEYKKYKEQRNKANKKSYQERKLKRDSDPEAMAKYKEETLKRTQKYSFRSKAKQIQDPKEREEFLRKHKEIDNISRRKRYQRNKEQTGKGSKRWEKFEEQKQRLREGMASQEDLMKYLDTKKKKREWDQISKSRKKAKNKDT